MPADMWQTAIFTMLSQHQRITSEILEEAFKRGLDPNASRIVHRHMNGRSKRYRQTLLQMLITSKQSPWVVEAALKAGADPNAKLPDGKSLTNITDNPRIRQLLKKYMSEQ